MRIPSQDGAVNESAPTLPLTEVANSTFLIVLSYVLRQQTEVFKNLKVYSRFNAMCVVPCQIFEATEVRGQLHFSLVYEVKTNASGASIGASSTRSYEDKGSVYLERSNLFLTDLWSTRNISGTI